MPLRLLVSSVQDDVVAAIEERMAMFSELPAANGEAMQILKYEPGQKYDPHQVCCTMFMLCISIHSKWASREAHE